MTTQDYQNIVSFEKTLAPGSRVEARWTNNFTYHTAKAEVVKVNRASVRVRIDDEKSYLHGREIPLPRMITFDKWSANNGVFHVEVTL